MRNAECGMSRGIGVHGRLLILIFLFSIHDSAFRIYAASPHHIWIEAENLGPLNGSNFSFQQPAITTKGSWSLAGPGVAAEWTQGGESEFLSIASRADEAAGVKVGRSVEVPASGRYALWVRYADYRARKRRSACE